MGASNRKGGGGGLGYSPAANRIPFGNGAGGLTDSADLTYDDSTNTLLLEASESAGDVEARVSNSSNTGSSNARLEARVAGPSGGDAMCRLNVQGQRIWDMLVANGTSDELEFREGGSNVYGRCSTSGDWAFGAATDANHRGKFSKAGTNTFLSMFATGSQAAANVAAIANAGETEAALMTAGANDATGSIMGVTRASRAFFYGASAQDEVVVGGTKATSALKLAPGNSVKATIDSNGDWTYVDGADFAVGTTTGSKIGTGTTQKLGFFGATPVTQRTVVADPSGGGTQDAEARTAIIAVISRMEELGFFASA